MNNTEMRMEARKKALAVAKTFGWPIPGLEYQGELDRILENLIKENIKKENEAYEQGG